MIFGLDPSLHRRPSRRAHATRLALMMLAIAILIGLVGCSTPGPRARIPAELGVLIDNVGDARPLATDSRGQLSTIVAGPRIGGVAGPVASLPADPWWIARNDRLLTAEVPMELPDRQRERRTTSIYSRESTINGRSVDVYSRTDRRWEIVERSR